jgi:hypothetical protein
MQPGGRGGGLVNPFSYFWLKVLKVKFFEFLALHDCFEGLLVFMTLIAFIFSLKYYGRHRTLRLLSYYFALFLLAEAIEFYLYISPTGERFALLLASICFDTLTIFEFCVFSLLILHYIAGAGRRLAVKLNTVIFFIAEIILFFRTFPRTSDIPLGLLEAIALVPPCVIYYYELFTSMNTKALKDRPSFWIVTGILCQAICNSSLILSMEYMGRFGDGAYAFGILIYCILFVLLMRAYRSSPEERVVA